MIILLTMLLCVISFSFWHWLKTLPERRAAAATGSGLNEEDITESFKKIPIPGGSKTWKKIIPGIVAAIIGLLFCIFVIHKPAAFGIVFGGLLPYLATQLLQGFKARTYRKDVKSALEFAAAVFGAKGSVEEWIHEAIPRLEGPLKLDFQQGSIQNRRDNTPITVFLENLMKKSPDQFFRWALAGILSNYKSSGNQEEFINEVMNELVSQERFERKMNHERQNSMKLMVAILMFPVMLFMLFQDTVEGILKVNITANFVLLLGLIGFVGLFLLAMRLTKTEMQ